MTLVRARMLAPGAVLMALVAALAMFFAMGSFGSDDAGAAGADLSGIYDIAVVAGVDDTGGNAALGESAAAGDCQDTLDNDTDGLIDFADPDCQNPTVILFQCIALLEVTDGPTNNNYKQALQCYTDFSLAAPGSLETETCLLGEGSDVNCNGTSFDELNGPPPPPPYTAAPPGSGRTVITKGPPEPSSAGDVGVNTVCFANVGGGEGPNIIAVSTTPQPELSLSTNGMITGTVEIFGNQQIEDCEGGQIDPGYPDPSVIPNPYVSTAKGAPTVSLAGVTKFPVRFVPLADPMSVGSPTGRTAGDTDFDDDGCDDEDELYTYGQEGSSKTITKGCGDDPYHPADSDPTDSVNDVEGAYTIQVTASRPDICKNGTGGQVDTLAPNPCAAQPDNQLIGLLGLPRGYFGCLADLQQDGNDLTARAFCTTDIANIANNDRPVNPELTDAEGDGLAGGIPAKNPLAVPDFAGREQGNACENVFDDDADTVTNDGCPDLYGDVDDKHTVLTGSLDKTNNEITIAGCFEDSDGNSPVGHAYAEVVVDQYSGHGTATELQILISSLADCQDGPPFSSGSNAFAGALVDWVRQPNNGENGNGDGTFGKSASPDGRDSDSDGCPDKQELGDDEQLGGLRDPTNPGDWYDVTGDGTVDLFNDIFGVAGVFGASGFPPSDPNANFDRGAGIAVSPPNAWNIKTGDGTIDLFNDIFGVAGQFGHTCWP